MGICMKQNKLQSQCSSALGKNVRIDLRVLQKENIIQVNLHIITKSSLNSLEKICIVKWLLPIFQSRTIDNLDDRRYRLLAIFLNQ